MIGYNRGDVVLVGFIFSDETGVKRRPAVIISSDLFHNGRDEVIVSAITSQTGRMLVGDYFIKAWQKAGLLYPSVATGIIRTIKKSLILRNLGSISSPDRDSIDKNLQMIFNLCQSSNR